jgi:hypothetical protein
LETERTPEREARAVVNQDFESEGCAGGYEALPKGLDGTAPDALPTEGPRHEELAEVRVSDQREHLDRRIVNTWIGIVNTKIGHGEHPDRAS